MTTPEKVLPIRNRQELESTLAAYRIPTGNWGRDGAKTIDDFWNELQVGESALRLTDESELIRLSWTVKVNVFCRRPGGIFRLVEAGQYEAGNWRPRNLHNSISEKRRALRHGRLDIGETAVAAARRALKEEIGVRKPLTLRLTKHIVHPPKKELRPFPDITTINHTHYFKAVLSNRDFRPYYYELQGKRLTVFVWEEFKE